MGSKDETSPGFQMTDCEILEFNSKDKEESLRVIAYLPNDLEKLQAFYGPDRLLAFLRKALRAGIQTESKRRWKKDEARQLEVGRIADPGTLPVTLAEDFKSMTGNLSEEALEIILNTAKERIKTDGLG